MKRTLLGTAVLVALWCVSAGGQERPLSQHRLSQLGLGSLQAVPDPRPLPPWSPQPPAGELVLSPDMVFGRRQAYAAVRARPESLSRQALRWSLRASRF